MDEIFGLKVSFIIYAPTTIFFFEIPPCPKHEIFIIEFANFGKNPSLYDIKKCFCNFSMRIEKFKKKKSSRPLLIILLG